MKRIGYFMGVVFFLLLVGCVSTTPYVIKPITPRTAIKYQSKHNAFLSVSSGAMSGQDGPDPYFPRNAALVNLVTAVAVNQSKIDNTDQQYIGRQDQRVFIHSLYRYLKAQHVFHRLRLVDGASRGQGGVRIQLTFNSTRVGEIYNDSPVIIDATLSLRLGKLFKNYHYFINESRPSTRQFANLYHYHANAAARRLMQDVIRDIQHWLTVNKL